MQRFYKLDSTRVTLQEYSWGMPWYMIPIVLLLKLLRIRIPGSSDDPPVETLQPFEVSGDVLPLPVLEKFRGPGQEFAALGFHSPICRHFNDTGHATKQHWLTLTHSSGRALGRLQHRLWEGVKPPREYLVPSFITVFDDGTFLVSTSGKPDLATPPNVIINRQFGFSIADLWQSHEAELRHSAGRTIRHAFDGDEAEAIEERLHASLRDFHLQRGVFVPLEVRLASSSEGIIVPPEGSLHADVIREINNLQSGQVSWAGFFFLLVISAVFFVSAGFGEHKLQGIVSLIGIVLFHELGHYVAMRIFGYRNLRMFFIPFFGAAVSGRNYNVSGWKKAVVSLAGPLPGIIIGTVIGVLGLISGDENWLALAAFTVGLNGFNLLPVLPLDGGWVLHTTLFCRHPVLDVGFKAVASIIVIAGGLMGLGWMLALWGGTMLVSLPLGYSLAKLAGRLRKERTGAWSTDAQTIPFATAERIIDEVKSLVPANTPAKVIAQHSLNVFETVNAHPPHWLATLAILFVHGASFVTACIAAFVFMVAPHMNQGDVKRIADNTPRFAVAFDEIETRPPAEDVDDGEVQITTLGNFPAPQNAERFYRDSLQRVPAEARITRFGRSVILSFPPSAKQSAEIWKGEMRAAGADAFISPTDSIDWRLSWSAPDREKAVAMEADLEGFFAVPAAKYLIPPWLPPEEGPPLDESHRRARQVLLRLEEVRRQAYNDPALKAVRERLFLNGGAPNLKNVQEFQHEVQAVVERHLTAERDKAADDEARELIDLFIRANDTRPAEKEDDLPPASFFRDEISRRAGQFPLTDGLPPPTARRYSGHGAVSTAGPRVFVEILTLQDTAASLPAIVRWLQSHQCVDVKYDWETHPAAEDVER